MTNASGPWRSVLRDLRAFCDLGSELDAVAYPAHLEFTLPRNGADIRGRIDRSTAGMTVQLDDAPRPISYKAFLASPPMANLARLAQQTLLLERVLRRRSRRELPSLERSVVLYNCFVAPRLTVKGATQAKDGLAALDELTEPPNTNGTRIVFLAAQAGQGKSSLLDVFTIFQARRFNEGDADRLCLYVDAQGRGLARLDEAIARQLNDLQFMLSYNAVVSLVREGLLTLVVDGFDELIGSRGTYDDAFGSLSNFIETLEGRGTIVAATRSSYFTREYANREALLSAGDDFGYELFLTELLPWDKRAQLQYFERVASAAALNAGDLRRAQDEFGRLQDADDANLLSRPLFARDLIMLVIDQWTAREEQDIGTTPELVSVLAGSYLERETSTKLRTRDRQEVVSVEELRQYYVEIADEMWRLETRELDARTLGDLAGLLIESWSLSGEARDVFSARRSVLPFLDVDESRKAVVFEHEVFFSYFLARSLASEILSARQGVAQSLLSKAALDAIAADFLASELKSQTAGVAEVVERLMAIAHSRHPRSAQIRMNCGKIVCALFRASPGVEGGIAVNRLAHLDFAGDDLSHLHLKVGTLSDVEFARCNLVGTQLSAETTSRVRFIDALIDPETTRLHVPGVDVRSDVIGVRVVDDSGVRAEYDATMLSRLLRDVELVEAEGIFPLYEVDPLVIKHVASLAHAYEQVNPIGSRHDRFGYLVTNKIGREVVSALEKAGLVVQVTKQVSGPTQQFYRKRFVPEHLMEGLWSPSGSEPIDRFWQTISSSNGEDGG